MGLVSYIIHLKGFSEIACETNIAFLIVPFYGRLLTFVLNVPVLFRFLGVKHILT